jgi:hypothetical protein
MLVLPVLFLAVASPDASPPVSLSLASTSKALGHVVTTVRLEISGGTEPTALQWTFRYRNAVIDHVLAAPGQQALLADKKINCADVNRETTCIVWGPNHKSMKSGVIANISFTFQDPSTEATVLSFYPKAAAGADGQSLPVNINASSDVLPHVSRLVRRIGAHARILISVVIAAILLGTLGLLYARSNQR